MGRVEDFADRYGQHIATPWQRTIAGAQRILMLVYDKELERTLRARKSLFELETHKALHEWLEVDVTDAFATWMGADEYRDAYFESPDDLQLKLDSEFGDFVAARIRKVLNGASANAVVAVFGVGSLFGLVRVSHVLRAVEPDIVGRLAIFFPGQYEDNNYRLLDARDGWNYLAVPITMNGMESI